MIRPLLSIVVPTKNRYKYLKSLIVLIDSFNFSCDDLEIVVQDNTEENDEILSFLASKGFTYVSYFHKKNSISVSENSNLSIINSKGEYICFIGDDDGVTKHIVEAVKWMKRNAVEVLVNTDAAYYWPEYINSISGSLSSSIVFHPYKKQVNKVDTKIVLNDLMERGFVDRGKLPLLYHGIVKRETLDKIYSIGNSYFPGPSPDIANGIALSLLVDNYILLDFPIVISGASKFHGGGIRSMKNNAADIDKLSFLPVNTKKEWEKNIPLVWTGETIWAESAIKALRYMGREDLISKVNFENLYAQFIVFHFPLRKLAYDLSENKIKLFFKIVLIFIWRYYKGGIRLLNRLLLNKCDGQVIYQNINNINQASEKFSEIESNFDIKDIVISIATQQ